MRSIFKKKQNAPQAINPWTGKNETVVPEVQSKPDPESFKFFIENSFSIFSRRLRGITMPNPISPRLFRRAMRFISAVLLFIYIIVFFFSIPNPISIMFIATDLVLLYTLWLSRR